MRRFHQFRTTWVTANFIRHFDFNAKDKEYIFDNDQCVFGVDISVYPYFNKWEVLSIDKTVYGPKSWKLKKFSTLIKDFYMSDEFSIGGKKWALKVYPNGNGTGEGNSLSLYVILSGSQTLKPYEKVYVRAKLRVLDQKQSKHLEKPILTWFNTTGESAGFDQFVSFTDLQNPAKGFIVNDTLSVQVEFVATSSTNYYSISPAQFLSTF
ncbi:MATH/TRAF domain [Arabidopsis suecica]|uniref:MATH/TRAF domain n=1 Tax=Arabidopsis suecica TaxID=45249 RepID=A0A8T1YQL3_ARASU|nr:MATH/TRAF domain [Arabidopsis suecica]